MAGIFIEENKSIAMNVVNCFVEFDYTTRFQCPHDIYI